MTKFNRSPSSPRGFLVIVGGIIAWTGLIAGVLITTPDYQNALTMSTEPGEMTWQMLVDHGVTNNAHIRLVNVRLVENSTDSLKVCPRDVSPDRVPPVILVPKIGLCTSVARRETEATSTLTGRFKWTEGRTYYEFLESFRPSELGSVQPELNRAAHFSYLPTAYVPKVPVAQAAFWISVAAVAVGLVICGSGGPSIYCVVFFTLPSIISMLGFPLRYGRGNTLSRMLYLVVGGGLIGYAYQLIFVTGQLGHIDGNMGHLVLGFIAGSFGIGACLGAIANGMMAKTDRAVEASAPAITQPKTAVAEACNLEPLNAGIVPCYHDRQMVAARKSDQPESMQTLTDKLLDLGFSPSEAVGWKDRGLFSSALIQMGCRNMVVMDAEEIEGELYSRLVSVLQDGLTVITLSGNTPDHQRSRLGTDGHYLVSDTDDMALMLSTHLSQIIDMAEKRRTSVVSLVDDEAIAVCLLGRRVLAAIRAQYDEQSVEVGPAHYGRFSFPPQTVEELTLA